MNIIKRRAKKQTKYGQESFVGIINSLNYDDSDNPNRVTSFDVEIPVLDNIVVKKVANKSGVSFSTGTKITVTRYDRAMWEIVGQASDGTKSTSSQNTLSLTETEGNVDSLKTEIENARDTYDNLDARLDDMRSDINTAQTTADNVENEVTNARDSGDTGTTYSNLDARLEDIEDRISALESA